MEAFTYLNTLKVLGSNRQVYSGSAAVVMTRYKYEQNIPSETAGVKQIFFFESWVLKGNK